MFEAVLILLFHWIADFLLQSRSMALNKSKSNYWLSIHVFYYTVGMAPLVLLIWIRDSFLSALIWLLLNSLLHWATDYITSRQTSKLYVTEKFYGWPAFFSMIGLDQWIHAACLLLSYHYIVIK